MISEKSTKLIRQRLFWKKTLSTKLFLMCIQTARKEKKINPLLNTVARYLNMHAQKGIALENMKTVVVLHGSATQNVLNDAAYQKKFNRKNPNTALIAALKEAKVELFVCGQSFIAHTHSLSEKSTDVKLALSALTVLVNYQHKGYQLINFN